MIIFFLVTIWVGSLYAVYATFASEGTVAEGIMPEFFMLVGYVTLTRDNILFDKCKSLKYVNNFKSPMITKYYDLLNDIDAVYRPLRPRRPPGETLYYLDLFGFTLKLDPKDRCYKLVDRHYHPLELLVLVNRFFDSMSSVNKHGYARKTNLLENSFMVAIREHMSGLGFKYQVLGNDENSYTMWYNLLFVNIYSLLVICLKNLEDVGGIEVYYWGGGHVWVWFR